MERNGLQAAHRSEARDLQKDAWRAEFASFGRPPKLRRVDQF